ncbi:MAG: SIS domain-containing protein [Gemmatimonadota bacterium]
MEHVRGYLDDLQAALAALDAAAVRQVRDLVAEARDRGAQIFLCGNGGSAATASHMTNDLGKGASYGRAAARRFRVVSLADNVPWLTALANDVSYEAIFAEQLENLGQPGDLLIAISGSGNSPNVLRAVEVARRKGMKSVGLTGFDGGKLAGAADLAIVAASHHMGRVEDIHTVILHAVCYYFMEEEHP